MGSDRPVVETPRLKLVACDLELAEAILAGRPQVERLLGAAMHPDWPAEDTRGFLPFQIRKLKADPSLFMWGVWLMVLKEDAFAGSGARSQVVIGDLGYKGPPTPDGAVDLGYGIVPEMRRKGYTFEAVKALVDWAFSHSRVSRVTADCYEDNAGSIRILEKLGMTRTGKDGRLILWSLRRSPMSSGEPDIP